MAPGVYTLDVRVGTSSRTLTCTVATAGPSSSCTGGNSLIRADLLNVVGGVESVVLTVDSHPVEIELTLRAEGVELLSTMVQPQYRTSHPNGDDCPPECRTAEPDLTY